MINPRTISILDYTYSLPSERIAQFPLPERDQSKLLIYQDGTIMESVFTKLADFIPGNSLLVFNDTKVIHARLEFRKETGAAIEIFCLEPVEPTAEIQSAFLQKGYSVWKCLVGNAKRWKNGNLEKILNQNDHHFRLNAEKIGQANEDFLIRFSWEPQDMTFAEVLELAGLVPLPPYISRKADETDTTRYQTIYAHYDGSVAAPTAGLHFTEKVFSDLERKSIKKEYVTLHVGAGTFKPVTTDILANHSMHTEQILLTKQIIQNLIQHKDGKIIAVGTTTMRTLESLYWFGVKLIKNHGQCSSFEINQWEPYEQSGTDDILYRDSLAAIINYMDKNKLTTLSGSTQLIIVPGYRFRIAQGIITNFHQPQSTLLLLIAAFIGQEWERAYRYALDHQFRFLSYGDSCLFYR
ncbi:MAG TPA: S-adenosylmethionine:tRNA ribosyltransferase-isomerase [Bacteroidales bacterium]|nr:S-adenosylmethionine:tRNA ribosyltransferase-isomerase [Bacteroidales bacterium]